MMETYSFKVIDKKKGIYVCVKDAVYSWVPRAIGWHSSSPGYATLQQLPHSIERNAAR